MVQGFSEEWAHSAVDELRARGIEIAPGLSESEIASIGRAFAVDVPIELALFLMAGVPTSPRWAEWLQGPEIVAARAQDWVARAFAFDIEHAQYWHPSFGEQPADTAAAVERALSVVAAAPPLIPVYSHRFLASAPGEGHRAVLSVYQAVDSIYYGYDLADYLAREFSITRPTWATQEPPAVPVWEELFEL